MTWATDRKATLPADWELRRRATFLRDAHTCTLCGWRDPTNRTLECDHHGDRDNHDLANLRTLCGKTSPNNCHGKRTSAQGNAARQRLARPPERHPGLRTPGGTPPPPGA